MALSILHTTSGVFIILFLVAKIAVHYYLDNNNNRKYKASYVLMSPLQFFLPYKAIVDKQFFKWKQICNLLLLFSGLSLIANIVVGVLIYLK